MNRGTEQAEQYLQLICGINQQHSVDQYIMNVVKGQNIFPF